jgi:ADP-dependent NAD(P)H-hydrate dehydratase
MPATDPAPPLPPLPPRPASGHKGTFGTVVIVGGCSRQGKRMVGAPALVALGALRAGAGLARIIAPAPIMNAAISICPSATGIPVPVEGDGGMAAHEVSRLIDEQAASAQCLVVGPGLGDGPGAERAALRAAQHGDIPVVIDADAINRLAEVPELHRDFRAAAILTPHPGEYRRLAESLSIDADPTHAKTRPSAAQELAQRLGCIVVLKGEGTVVSDGQRTWLNPSGGPMLATAGTGDVLAGVIAGLIAQFVAPAPHPKLPRPPGRPLDLFDAARLAVHAHGLAGERWSQARHAEAGLLATELADLIPESLQSLRHRGP